MKLVVVYLFIVCFINGYDCDDSSTYTTKYDGIDLDEILASERLLVGYINCLLDQGPCTPDGKELKGNLPDAISNDCSKCTERQRQGADQVMHYIIDHRPDDWLKLETMYKSDGSYKRKYEETKTKKSSGKKDNDEDSN